MKTSRLVFFWISGLQLVDLGPLAADDDARARGVDVDLQLVRRALDLDLRDAGVREALLQAVAQLQVLVQQLRVVLVGEPARAPGLVEAEPESVSDGLSVPFVTSFASLSASFAARAWLSSSLAAAWRGPRFALARRRGFGRGASPLRPRRRDLARPLRDPHRQVRGPLDDAERAAHRGRTDPLLRRPLVGVARRRRTAARRRRRTRPCCCALAIAERSTFSMSRAIALARELQRRQRVVDVAAADQIEHQPGLLRRRPDVLARSRAPEPPLRASPWRRRRRPTGAAAPPARPCPPWSCAP